MMVLAVWTIFCYLEWCKNHTKVWGGGRFLNIWGSATRRLQEYEGVTCERLRAGHEEDVSALAYDCTDIQRVDFF